MIKSWIGFAALIILLNSCNSPGPKKPVEEKKLDPAAAYMQFSKNFATITLPYGVPKPGDNKKGVEINRKLIETLFSEKSFKPAFEQKDVPELSDNIQSANYFYDGMWQTDGFQAFIVKKVEGDNYWYLSTFTKDGQFIDGMCIGFRIGDQKAGTERRAVINDDQSVLIRQVDIGEGLEPDSPGKLYEIAADGRIVPMENKNLPI
jgi:hypothetical protein